MLKDDDEQMEGMQAEDSHSKPHFLLQLLNRKLIGNSFYNPKDIFTKCIIPRN